MLDTLENVVLLVDGSLFPLIGDASSSAAKLASSVLGILKVAVGLGFVIFVHELGHFLAAKFFGVKCEKFYVGFDVPIRIGPVQLPAALGRFRWGETEYGVGLIPLGGYVKMLGQDDDPRRAAEEADRIKQADPNASDDAPRVRLDPRSYPAKPVYARMIIISAGVIMNLIFAVLMATWAYRVGVPYLPTIVGGVTPGNPAWHAGLEPGDQILQAGDMKSPNPHLHFWDMAESIAFSGLQDEQRVFPLVFERGGESQSVQVTATKKHDQERFRAQIGVGTPHVALIEKNPSDSPAFDDVLKKLFQEDDRVLAVDGSAIPNAPGLDAPLAHEVFKRMDGRLDQAVTVQIERRQGNTVQTLDVTVPPLAMQTLGFASALGPITAVQAGSPAQKAGVQIGDKILSLNDQEVTDGLTLHLAVLKLAGKPVSVRCQALDGQQREVNWTVPARPTVFLPSPSMLAPTGYELYGSGMCHGVQPIVSGEVASDSESQPANSGLPAESGLQPGDRLIQIQVIPSDDQHKKELLKIFSKELLEAKQIDDRFNLIWVNQLVQYLPEGTQVKVHYERDKLTRDTLLVARAAQGWNLPGRGLNFQLAKRLHQTDSVTEALTLGAQETWKRTWRVIDFLHLAFTGRMKMKAVGGPVMIFAQASSAASEGIPKLLMFLVMLSANLAILNFLPIPALDGGHMMFLTLEALFGKPVNEVWQMRLTMMGVLGLLALMVLVLVNDTLNLIRIFG
jgi:regulator of sigma E protease